MDGPKKFIGEPSPYTQEDYLRLRQTYVNRLRAIPGVSAVYEYGNTAYHPGFSDLDVIAVTQERLGRHSASQLTALPTDDPAWRILRNPAKVVSERLFSDPLTAPHWADSLCHRAGQVLTRRPIDPADAQHSQFILMLNRMPQAVIGLAQRMTASHWHIVSTLSHLRALSHNLKRYEKCTGTALDSAQEYVQAVHALRREWGQRDGDRYPHLITLVAEGLRISYRLLAWLEVYFINQGWAVPQDDGLLEVPMSDGFTLIFRHLQSVSWGEIEAEVAQRRIPLSTVVLQQLVGVVRHAPALVPSSLARYVASLPVHAGRWELRGGYGETLQRYLCLQQARAAFQRANALPVVVCEGAWWSRLAPQPPTWRTRVADWLRQMRAR